MSTFLPFIVAGITAGSVYGLAGVGLVLTYRTSGIFNFAHGALATAGAYLFFELWVQHGVPWPVALLVSVAALGAVLGVGMELLARRLSSAPAYVVIVATVGLLLAVEAVASLRYGANTIVLTPFLPTSTFEVAGVRVGYDQLVIVLTGVAVSAGLALLLARTRTGIAMRGVVDDAALMEITGFDARGVRRIAWMLGGAVAVLSGVLIAPSFGLDPIRLTFLVVQAFGAAALGRFRNLPLTFAGGLVIGIAAALGQKYASDYTWLLGLPASVPFLVLFAVLVTARPGSLPVTGTVRRRHVDRLTPPPAWARAALATAGLVLLLLVPPLVGSRLPLYINAAGFVIVFLSLGLLVKTAGQVSLCHAAFVAVGAVAFSRFSTDLGLPWPVALLAAGLVTVPIGAVVALPAIRLSGVYLALATFAFGLLMENLLYRTALFFGEQGHRIAPRPVLPGGGPASDTAYFYIAVAIALLCGAALIVLQRSRLGRLLRALANSPLALSTYGAGVTTTLVLVFCISAFFAGVAGGVLATGTQAAGPAGLGSLQSLIWIAVLAISGGSLVGGAVIAALLLAVLPSYLPQGWQDYQTLAFGAAAVLAALVVASGVDWVARLRGDLAGTPRRSGLGPIAARTSRPARRGGMAGRLASKRAGGAEVTS